MIFFRSYLIFLFSFILNDLKKLVQLIVTYPESNYPSGVLFAFMAKVYLEYALYGYVTKTTEYEIMCILNKVKVYQYYKLPLAILCNNKKMVNEICHQFEWVDYNFTVETINKFIERISI